MRPFPPSPVWVGFAGQFLIGGVINCPLEVEEDESVSDEGQSLPLAPLRLPKLLLFGISVDLKRKRRLEV